MPELKVTYEQIISEGRMKIKRLSRTLYTLSFMRLTFFLLCFILPFWMYRVNGAFAVLSVAFSLSMFLFLVKKYQQTSILRKFEQLKVELNLQEIEALQHQFSMFDSGTEFIDPNHMNSYDLDLFGKGSLFQFINRTVTPKGKQNLAQMLQSPMLKVEDLQNRQYLIKELTLALTWRQDFSTWGKLYGEDKNENDLFGSWSKQVFALKSEAWLPVLFWVLPLISLISLGVWIFIGSSIAFIFSTILQMVLWYIEKSNIKNCDLQFGKRANVLQKYEVLFREMESFPWESSEGKQRRNDLIQNGIPSMEARKLRKIVTSFDNRNNFLFGVPLNLVFLWDILHSYRLIKWHRRNQGNYQLWINAIAFTDACNSLGNYACNHPDANYPGFSQGEFQLSAVQMGHPLIHRNKRVSNDFDLGGTQQLQIITGANMSGKSTFLRTIGVNMVLGMCGAPVCARKMNFKPVEVFSNMRTTDSLFDDESYFFAELKRLQAILEEVDKGRDLLIILDEILKGTNSVDKLYGSQKLVHRLIAKGTSAIIATHDLKLTEIELEFPDKVKNQCFEISIENDEMQFDYTLQSGVTTIMNASFLMKKMGIIE
ncbi:MAG: hypothetical protein ACERKD_06635 [Prolixibacteraceae bacterium]